MNPKTKLQKKADNLWREIILRRAKGRCEVCGKRAIQAHHYYRKGGYGHLRYDLNNGIALCTACHFSIHFTAKCNEIDKKIRDKRGKKWENSLYKKSKQKKESFKTIKYYEQVIKKLSANSPANSNGLS